MTKPCASLRVFRRQTVLLIAVFFMLPITAKGRENSVTAGLAVREGYDSNMHRTDENHVLQWTTTLTPSLNFVSQGQSDRLDLSYAPGLQVVDHESSEPGVDKPADFAERSVNHDLTIKAEKDLARDLQFLLSEEYIKADDPDLRPHFMWEPDRGLYVSETIERRRYWTNAASLAMRYAYAKDSSLAIGYDNRRLENEDANLAGGYDRHHPTVTIDHRFNEQWRTVAGYAYTKANFQQAETLSATATPTDDLVSHNPTLEVDYNPWLHATAFGSYSFDKYEYQNGLRDGYHLNDSRLGWRQELGPKSTADLSAGYSQTNWDAGGSEGGLGFEGHVATTLGQTTVSCGAAKGFEARYFDGTDSGLSKYWRLQAALMYQLTQNLTTDLSASYRKDKFIEARQGIEEDVSQVATGCSYKLSRWAILSLHYIFHNLTTTADIGDYDDHRLFLELRTSRELWRW
ncbi:MAG: hypothetical protein AUK28_06690 [Desulfobacterales bacterium CG2_30_60_27]|nr:MAG: hypothetical protein AUK28_06690 [Desulfobacterales bacterium CG2_30_60_27]